MNQEIRSMYDSLMKSHEMTINLFKLELDKLKNVTVNINDSTQTIKATENILGQINKLMETLIVYDFITIRKCDSINELIDRIEIND